MASGSGYAEVLRVRDARALIGASTASQLGDWLYNAALLGYVYAETGSAAWVGAATIGRLLPYVLLGPVGGAVADRFPQRTVLLVGDALRLLLMLALAAVVALDLGVVPVIALTALASAAGTAEKPAALSLLPRLVGESRLGSANALLHTGQEVGVVAGPALGALLLALAPDWTAFLANAATFGVSALLLATLGRQPSAAGARAGAGAQLAEGLRVVRRTPFVPAIFLAVAAVELTYGAQSVQLVVYAQAELGLGTGGYGVLLAALGAGGLLGAVVVGPLASARRLTLVVVGASVVACAAQLAFAATGAVAVAVLVAVATGAAMLVAEVVGETALARTVPPEVLGRVTGLFDAASVGAMVLGAVLAPVVLEATSLRTSLVVLGAAAVLVAALSALGLRGLDAASARRVAALAERIALLRAMPITADVPDLVLERLAAVSHVVPLPSGVDVVVQGAPAHAFFGVAEGAVLIHRDGVPVARCGPGDSFGERGLLEAAPRNATVTTETASVLLRVEGDALLDALQAAPGWRATLDGSNRTPTLGPTVDDPTLAPA